MIALLAVSILAAGDGSSAVIDCTRRTPPLFAAIVEGDIARVRARVRRGDDVNGGCDLADGGISWPLEERSRCVTWRSPTSCSTPEQSRRGWATEGTSALRLRLWRDLGP